MMECQRAEEAGINDGGENCDSPKPLLIKQRVVWFDDEGSSHSGCIKWIGKLHEMGDDLIAGVELDEPHGKNDGRWGSLRLFTTRPNHGLIVPVTALMKEEEFLPGSNCDDSFYSLPKTDYVDCRPKILTDTRNKVECSLDKMDYAEKEQFSYQPTNYVPTKQARKHRKHCPLPSDELLVDDKNAVEINKLLMQLELAISNGFVEKASYLARKLAELKIKCSVVRKKAPNLAPSTGNILINLYVEDSTSHIGPITLEINPSMTVGQLKRKIEQEFDFPSCLQRWILGKKLANDDNASISSFDITSSGCAVFLYLTINDGSIADMYKRKLETYLQAIEDFDLDEVPNNDEDNSEFYDCVAEDNVDHNYSQQKSQIKVLKSGSSKAQEDLTRQFCIEDRVVWYNNGKPEHGYICYVEPPGSKNGIVVGVEFDREITFAPGRVHNGAVFSQYKEYGDFLIEDLFHEEDGACQNFDKSKLKFQNSKVEPKPVGWNCPSCTYVNVPTWPGCRMCGTAKPQDYVIPPNYKLSDEEKARLRKEEEMEKELKIARDKYKVENYQRLVDLDNIDVVLNDDKFECVICYTEVDPGDGVRIRECLHTFCRDCIANVIEHSETAEVKCPYLDDKYSCPAIMQDREIRALVSAEIYERHLQKSIALAENQAENSFHCKTANCAGWCFYDDNINEFICPVCSVNNCLTCQAIHEGYNCKQYQDKLEFESVTNVNARKTKEALDAMLAKGEAMKCPKCQIIIQKKIGCDWLCCTMCRTEICWVTKGPRWGPLGKGDISGGCKCGVNQVRCHPNCGYCH